MGLLALVGLILLVIGLIEGLTLLWIIGAILLVVGVLVLIPGGPYRQGRSHWYW